MDDELHARQFAALAHPARLKILRWLARHEACQCKDVVSALPLAQSTVSQHLKILNETGLISMDQRGPSSIYKLDRAALSALGDATGQFVETCCETAFCGTDGRAMKAGACG